MNIFKIGDRVVCTNGMYVGMTGKVIEHAHQQGYVRVKLRGRPNPVMKNVRNLTLAIPSYLLMDKGL